MSVARSSFADGEAASTSDAALAETLFREGRQLLEANQLKTACEKLAESYRLDARLGTLMNLAACHEMEGKTATAWAEFLDAARLAHTRTSAEAKKLERTAETRAKELEPKLHHIEIAVAAPASDLVLTLDGRTLNSAAWSTPLPIDPGRHVLTAQRPGYVSQTQNLDVEASPGRSPVRVPELQRQPPPPEKPVALEKPKPMHSEPPPPSRISRPVFLASAGVAVVAIGVGTFFGVRALDAKSSRDDACEGGACSPDGLEHQRDAFDAATISTIGFVVGAAAVTVAVVSYLWPSRTNPTQAWQGAALRF